jgi:nucleoid-associated protein YgaU
MSRFAQLIRFLVGVSMVAGGVALVTPFAVRFSEVVADLGRDAAAATQAVPTPTPGAQPQPVESGASPTAGMPVSQQAVSQQWESRPLTEAPGEPEGPIWATASSSSQSVEPPLPPQADYQPPAPPAPLPPQPSEFAQPHPVMQGIYRSSLDVPPPPLLDAQRPPPLAAAWPMHAAARPAPQPAQSGSLPATYRVRDGDDLAGIAARMYGHPTAATALWAANRDLISDPNLLPIGAELRLPPPWEIDIAGATTGGGAVIEPRRGPVATPATATVGGRIRVAPGDSLAAIAGRLYGDPALARQIWELNRDQLRSPELVVPGMELRLPSLPR